MHLLYIGHNVAFVSHLSGTRLGPFISVYLVAILCVLPLHVRYAGVATLATDAWPPGGGPQDSGAHGDCEWSPVSGGSAQQVGGTNSAG